MQKERWRRVEELFHAASEQPPETRRAFLEKVDNGDLQVLDEVDLF